MAESGSQILVCTRNHLEGLLKHRFLGSIRVSIWGSGDLSDPQSFYSVNLSFGTKFCRFYQSPDDADAASPEITHWELIAWTPRVHCCKTIKCSIYVCTEVTIFLPLA